MKKFKTIITCLILFIGVAILSHPVTAKAASYKMVDDNQSANFGENTIGFSWYEHTIWMKNGNRKTTLIQNDNLVWGATTNGTELFYGCFYGTINDLGNEWGMDIYKMNLNSRTSELIGKLKYGTKVVFCYDEMLYVETAPDGGAEIPALEQFSIATKESKLLYSHTSVHHIQGDYLICCTEPGEFDNTGHYMYKVCVFNYKKTNGKLLAKQGFGVIQYKKNKIRFIKVLKNKRIYSAKVYEYNLKTGKNKAISKKFQSGTAQVILKKKKVIYYDKQYKKRTLTLK